VFTDDEYFRALKKLRDHNKLVEDTLSVSKSDKKPVLAPPANLEYSKTESDKIWTTVTIPPNA